MTTHYQKIQALGNKMVLNLESMGVSANFNDGGMTLADKILEIQHFDNGLKLYADKNIGQIGDEINLYALVLKDNIAQSGKTILFKGLVNSTGTTKTFNANSTNIIGDKYEITSFPDLSNGSKVYLDKDHKIWLVHMGGDYGTVLQFLSQTETGTNGTGTLSKIVVENNTLTYWVGGYSVTIDFKNGGYDRDLSVITTENNTLTITDYSVYGVTGNNGIANVTYTCSGVGDKNIQAIYQSSNGILLQETYSLEDCLFYDDASIDKTSDYIQSINESGGSLGTLTYGTNEYQVSGGYQSQLFRVNEVLPQNCEISADVKGPYAIGVGFVAFSGNTNSVDAFVHSPTTFYKWKYTNRSWVESGSATNGYGRTYSDYVNITIIRTGTSVEVTVKSGDAQILHYTKTLQFSNSTDVYGGIAKQGNDKYFKNLKIKAL